jgi:hypothetical protein
VTALEFYPFALRISLPAWARFVSPDASKHHLIEFLNVVYASDGRHAKGEPCLLAKVGDGEIPPTHNVHAHDGPELRCLGALCDWYTCNGYTIGQV